MYAINRQFSVLVTIRMWNMVELFFFLSLFSFPFFFCSFDILIDSLYISIWRTDLHTIERMSQHRHTNDDDDDGNVHIVCMMKCDRLTECTERSKRQKAYSVIVCFRYDISFLRAISQCSPFVMRQRQNQANKKLWVNYYECRLHYFVLNIFNCPDFFLLFYFINCLFLLQQE